MGEGAWLHGFEKLSRGEAIIDELLATLNMDAGEIAERLQAIYVFCKKTLIEAPHRAQRREDRPGHRAAQRPPRRVGRAWPSRPRPPPPAWHDAPFAALVALGREEHALVTDGRCDDLAELRRAARAAARRAAAPPRRRRPWPTCARPSACRPSSAAALRAGPRRDRRRSCARSARTPHGRRRATPRAPAHPRRAPPSTAWADTGPDPVTILRRSGEVVTGPGPFTGLVTDRQHLDGLPSGTSSARRFGRER